MHNFVKMLKCSVVKCSNANCTIVKCSNDQLSNAQMSNAQMSNAQMSNAQVSNAQMHKVASAQSTCACFIDVLMRSEIILLVGKVVTIESCAKLFRNFTFFCGKTTNRSQALVLPRLQRPRAGRWILPEFPDHLVA